MYKKQVLTFIDLKKVYECLNIRHILLTLGLCLASLNAQAFVQDDDLSPIPMSHNVWVSKVFVPDDAGVFDSIRGTYASWINTEEYIDNWNLRSTKMYNVPTQAEKASYTGKILLKYIDKRISGEVRKADKGSTLYAVGQAQKALKPQSEVSVARNIKIKFKARVIQRRAIMLIKNPLMDYQATINTKGHLLMTLTRNIDSIGVFTSINYEKWNEYWVTSFDRPITNKISTRLSSSQSDKIMAFTRNADTRLEFFFNHYF